MLHSFVENLITFQEFLRETFCYIIYVLAVTSDEFNASLLNKSIIYLKYYLFGCVNNDNMV